MIDLKNHYIAHVRCLDAGTWDKPHLLEVHLYSVANLAKSFADKFNAGEFAYVAGLWHDLGKYQQNFQNYIRNESGYNADSHLEGSCGRVTHSTAGALHAHKAFNESPAATVLSYLVMGHHAGLPDASPKDQHGQSSVRARLHSSQSSSEYEATMKSSPSVELLSANVPANFNPDRTEKGFALWVRLLFSCLVDADRLDTEAYMQPEQAILRAKYPRLKTIKEKFDNKMQSKFASVKDLEINKLRADILSECINTAQKEPGIYSLTVPTGGGKTLSSLAFGLEHAVKYNKNRIIYAIPFTSIIEQNAAVFRDFLGAENVLEHHCNFAGKNHTDGNGYQTLETLATENWDAPVIVTTNVQFFESLFSAKPSRCRKLHNIINSVVILDEVQTLPRDFLQPILTAIDLLSKHYGVTFLFCTATQPGFKSRKNAVGQTFMDAPEITGEIISDPLGLAKKLQRVNIHFPNVTDSPVEWPDIANKMQNSKQVLTIVNSRQDCLDLYRLLPQDSSNFHLSALMCAEHRSDTIKKIGEKLKNGESLRVVSTQLIEAGVDLDFPVVFRALAGLDSIAQAAGRCNREGLLSSPGQVYVFLPPKMAPAGLLRQGQQVTVEMLKSGRLKDGLSPDLFHEYFNLFYSQANNLDKENITELQHPRNGAGVEVQFRTVGDKFQLINDLSESVVVPYNPYQAEESPIEGFFKTLTLHGPNKSIYRKLQRHTVSIPRYSFDKLFNSGVIKEECGLWRVCTGYYSETCGLIKNFDEALDSFSLVL